MEEEAGLRVCQVNPVRKNLPFWEALSALCARAAWGEKISRFRHTLIYGTPTQAATPMAPKITMPKPKRTLRPIYLEPQRLLNGPELLRRAVATKPGGSVGNIHIFGVPSGDKSTFGAQVLRAAMELYGSEPGKLYGERDAELRGPMLMEAAAGERCFFSLVAVNTRDVKASLNGDGFVFKTGVERAEGSFTGVAAVDPTGRRLIVEIVMARSRTVDQGVGHALMEALKELLRDHCGGREVVVALWAMDTKAAKWFRGRGFHAEAGNAEALLMDSNAGARDQFLKAKGVTKTQWVEGREGGRRERRAVGPGLLLEPRHHQQMSHRALHQLPDDAQVGSRRFVAWGGVLFLLRTTAAANSASA